MFFLPEYDILYIAAQNPSGTIPVECKVHSLQGHTRYLQHKQGILRTDSFPFLPRRPQY